MHPCKSCLKDTPTKYHQCDSACDEYRFFLADVTGESVRLVSQQSADIIRHNQQELDPDDIG